MPDNEDEATYALAMPFIVCTSQNGPYGDEPFAAGWTCGALNAELASCRQVAANPRGRHMLPGILPQVDLIAMNHGFTVRRDPERDSPGWAWVEFDQAGCSCA